MKFSSFIRDNIDDLIAEWESFARTLLPALSDLALRDHCRGILLELAADMDTSQTRQERSDKSKRLSWQNSGCETAASSHGALRQLAGFDLSQLVAEFHALRASVLALWRRSKPTVDIDSAIEEIARFNEGIDQALAESVESYAKDVATFLAVVGHDLRSPLWAIQGTSEVLATSTVSVEILQEAMRRIMRSSKVMARLIGDLLEFTGTQLGQAVALQPALSNFGEACEEALDSVKAIYPNQQFTASFSGDLDCAFDAIRMQQVLVNLLINAVQHGDAKAPVGLRVDGEADAVVLEVSNQGRLLPASALQSIFEPLVQVPSRQSQAHQPPYTSLGLGLFIVREIVARHHGTVVAESTPSNTVFTVRLPRELACSEPPLRQKVRR